MNESRPLVVGAAIASTERAAFVAGFEQLGDALAHASGAPSPVHLRVYASIDSLLTAEPADLTIVSMFTELERGEPLEATHARLAAGFTALLERGATSVFVATIFRHVPERPPELLERIRRLNLLAAELSNETGIDVIDIDRTVTHYGARDLQTDFRLTGALGAEVAGYAIVASILGAGLEESLEAEARAAAVAFHGPIWEMSEYVNRRLQRKAGAPRGTP